MKLAIEDGPSAEELSGHTLNVDSEAGAEAPPPAPQSVRRWFEPIVERRTWLAAGYVASTLALGLLWMVVTLVVMAVALSTIPALIGVPLTIGAFALVARIADFARRRAWMADVTIAPRPLADGPGLFSRFATRIGDGARWRQVGYLLSAFFVAIAAFAVAIAGWGLAGYLISLPLWGWSVGLSMSTALALAVLGVFALGMAPRVTIAAAGLDARYAGWLLGADPVAVMQERVEDLSDQRTDILDAVATERRRIERNLHDGVQQSLVAMGIDIGMAASKLPDDATEAKALLEAASDKARSSIGELRVIGRGLHPAILGDRGLDAALSSVVAGSPVPIQLRCELGARVPAQSQEVAYFVVSEAVSNVLKHADARVASIDVREHDSRLEIVVEDDGRGGADPDDGTGLAGIGARVRAVDGEMRVTSPPGGPTKIEATVPFGSER